jgi:hypothetical protein
MERDVSDLKNPDLYVAGVPHEIFTRLRREDPLYWNPESDGPASGASRATMTSSRSPKILRVSARRGSMEAIGCSMSGALASAPGVGPV